MIELVYNNKLKRIFFFSFFNAKDEPTRYKYLFYYTFCLLENTILIGLWALHWHGFITYGTYSGLDLQKDSASWYFYPGIVGHYLAFFAGIMFMVLYYYFFHPSGNINKSFFPSCRKRKPINETKSSQPSIQNVYSNQKEKTSLQNIESNTTSRDNVQQLNERPRLKNIISSGLEEEIDRPSELHIETVFEVPGSRAACVTPSLSSPVLDNIDSLKGSTNASQIVHPPLSRSASVPTLTPPLNSGKFSMYIPSHRRLKAMHGKERFKSGDGK